MSDANAVEKVRELVDAVGWLSLTSKMKLFPPEQRALAALRILIATDCWGELTQDDLKWEI